MQRRSPAWRRPIEVTLVVVGAVALFLGLFVLFAGEDQSIGFFGIWSTAVTDVSGAWTIALLAGGSLVLAASLYSIVRRRLPSRASAPGDRGGGPAPQAH